MKNKNQKNIVLNKYKTYDLLAINMLFVGMYSLVTALAINKSALFFTKSWFSILFILSICFFFAVIIVHVFLAFLNRQIDCSKGVVQNIKRINILYLSIIYTKILFYIVLIPIQLLLILILLKDTVEAYYYISIIAYCIFSVFSVATGLYVYFKKRVYIKVLKKELSQHKLTKSFFEVPKKNGARRPK